VVVACHPLRRPVGFFETVLYFVETPCSKLQKAACDCRLAHEHEHPRGKTQFTTDNSRMDGAFQDGAAPPSRTRSAQARR
jgi:hypothetical protein